MSKRCELTGISPLKGHNVSHAKNKTKRRFLPNLKKVIFKSDILNKNIRLNVTNAALRTVDFKGGLDKFLMSAKSTNLSKKVKKGDILSHDKITWKRPGVGIEPSEIDSVIGKVCIKNMDEDHIINWDDFE